MNSIEDFNTLAFDDKCDYVTTCADYLIYRIADAKKYYLYHVASYFIEVTYDPCENEVLCIEAFSNTADLDPYLHAINISALSS